MLKCHFNKVADLWPATLLKRDPAQVFSREFCEIFYSTYFVCLSHVIQNRCSKKSRKIHGKIYVSGCFWY